MFNNRFENRKGQSDDDSEKNVCSVFKSNEQRYQPRQAVIYLDHNEIS